MLKYCGCDRKAPTELPLILSKPKLPLLSLKTSSISGVWVTPIPFVCWVWVKTLGSKYKKNLSTLSCIFKIASTGYRVLYVNSSAFLLVKISCVTKPTFPEIKKTNFISLPKTLKSIFVLYTFSTILFSNLLPI